MEVLLKKPLAAGDEKMAELKAAAEATMAKELATHRRSLGATSPSSSPAQRSLTSKEQEDELESTRAEMVEAREENERLRVMLARILKDYESLQGQFMDMVQSQQQQQKEQYSTRVDPVDLGGIPAYGEELDLVSLRLGTAAASAGGAVKEEKASTSASWGKKDADLTMGGELRLGLDCKVEGSSSASTQPTVNVSTENSLEDPKDDDACGGQWPPGGKVAAGKSARSPGDDEVSQHIQIKKARVSVRTRCDGPTMNDGCQWRKYGQKISKGNPCPRAYYRCTVAPACPVRKQVQRCAEDMSILITTYEGTHNHPLPMSATAMASTTAAAASMLISGPSAPRPGILSSPFATTAATSNAGSLNPTATPLHGLNFSFSDASRAKPYFLPHVQPMTTTPTHPTITLDLTSPLPSTGATTAAAASAAFNRYPSPFASSIQRYPASLSFSSSDANTSQSPWNQLYGSKSQASRSPYQSPYLMRNSSSMMQTQQQPLSDSLAKAITSDPNFKSALAAAITSIVGGQGAQISAGGQLSSLASLTTAATATTTTTTTTTLANRLLTDQSSSFFLPAPLNMEKQRDHITKQSSS